MKRGLDIEGNSMLASKRQKDLETSNIVNMLPEDIILHILLFLQQHELWKIQQTCKIFRGLLYDSQAVSH